MAAAATTLGYVSASAAGDKGSGGKNDDAQGGKQSVKWNYEDGPGRGNATQKCSGRAYWRFVLTPGGPGEVETDDLVLKVEFEDGEETEGSIIKEGQGAIHFEVSIDGEGVEKTITFAEATIDNGDDTFGNNARLELGGGGCETEEEDEEDEEDEDENEEEEDEDENEEEEEDEDEEDEEEEDEEEEDEEEDEEEEDEKTDKKFVDLKVSEECYRGMGRIILTNENELDVAVTISKPDGDDETITVPAGDSVTVDYLENGTYELESEDSNVGLDQATVEIEY